MACAETADPAKAGAMYRMRAPYRPKLFHDTEPAAAADDNDGPYQPGKVVVMDLPPTTTRTELAHYFEPFGNVRSIVVKYKPTVTYAFIEFDNDGGVVKSLGTHAFKDTPVRVLRAFKFRMPTRPFPGMEPRGSPLRQTIAHQQLFGSAPPPTPPTSPFSQTVRSAWSQDTTMWETPLFESIASLWA